MAFSCNFSSPMSLEHTSAGHSNAHKLRVSPSTSCIYRIQYRIALIRTQIRAVKSNHAASDQVSINGEEMDVYGKRNVNGASELKFNNRRSSVKQLNESGISVEASVNIKGEDKRRNKKKVEEIVQEEAWFKKSREDKTKVLLSL